MAKKKKKKGKKNKKKSKGKRIKKKIKKRLKKLKKKKSKKNRDFVDLTLVRQSRLSVMDVDLKSWKKICKMGKV